MAKALKKPADKTGLAAKKSKSAAAPKALASGKPAAKSKAAPKKKTQALLLASLTAPAEMDAGSRAEVLDRLFATIAARRGADPSVSHSARLLSRGTAKVAQKFGEEAVECLIEAVAGNTKALIAESADVLYHLLVLWVDAGVDAQEVWAELERRQGVSGIAEKAARAQKLSMAFGLGTTKIP